jgi:uncharacterized membrane protein YdjX (TVP38/TMEM64 family)
MALAAVALITGIVALIGYITQPAMRQASDNERARFRAWMSAARITFGVTFILAVMIAGSLIRPAVGLAGLLGGCFVAYYLDERFDLWIR